MNRPSRGAFALLTAGSLLLYTEGAGRAAVPVGYKGKPFDPAVVGGAGKIPPTVLAGPYPIPGRIDFINYDMGGENVAYKCGDHITNNGSESIKLALGYRTDAPTATLCLTNQVEKDSWYQTGTALDGTFFPSPTTADYYIGAVRPGDWFNYTVDVRTAGMYTLSSTWASGNGPPGGEGGNGAMELQVYVNNVMMTDWKATFPNYQTAATFHNWMPFPNFATIALDAGVQVIKLQSVDAHLNLAYVQFALVSDGGVDDGGASSDGGSGDGGRVAMGGGSDASGSTPIGGSSSSGGSSGGGVAGGGPSGGDAGTGNGAGSGGGGEDRRINGSGCAIMSPSPAPSGLGFGLALAGALFARSRRWARDSSRRSRGASR